MSAARSPRHSRAAGPAGGGRERDGLMLAARWHARGDVRVEQVAAPRLPGPLEVQVEVLACGICGTDIEEFRNGPIFVPVDVPHPLTGRVAPLILGHEFAGRVVVIGSGVKDLRLGDRVAVDTLVYCGSCEWCRRQLPQLCHQLGVLGIMADGGLAERCNVPAAMCVRVPETVSDEGAAVAEPLAVAVRAVGRGRLIAGERVAIVGAGSVGLLALQVARARGASDVMVIEPLASRRQLALDLGASVASATIEPALHATADLVLECSGVPASLDGAISLARKRGRVVLVGIDARPAVLHTLPLVMGEREVIGSLSHVHDEDLPEAVRLLADESVRVEPIVTDRIPLARLVEDGLRPLIDEPDRHLKVIVFPHGGR
jgi:(R,R)-butanediol dehydrogenase/meso-butanediol dehydrogenase/diacetyl reductase